MLRRQRHRNGWLWTHWLLLPPPGLALAHAHRLGHGDVAQLVEAAGDDAGEAGAHVQGAVRLVPRHHRRHQQQPRHLERETVFTLLLYVKIQNRPCAPGDHQLWLEKISNNE